MSQNNMNQNDKTGQQGSQKDQDMRRAPGQDHDKGKDGQFGSQKPGDKNQQQNRETQR